MALALPVFLAGCAATPSYTELPGLQPSNRAAPHDLPDAPDCLGTGTVERDANGRIKRDFRQRLAFRKDHPCPSTGRTSGACPGYVVDHVIALKRGGPDLPCNMQWQSKEEARAKDRWE